MFTQKALVTLKFQQSKEKLENEMKRAEEEYLTKMKIYNTIPDQLARIQDEFTKKVKMIENAISYERVCKQHFKYAHLGHLVLKSKII